MCIYIYIEREREREREREAGRERERDVVKYPVATVYSQFAICWTRELGKIPTQNTNDTTATFSGMRRLMNSFLQ